MAPPTSTARKTMEVEGEKGEEKTEQEQEQGRVALPRVTIQFCTQCKWMLRAAYLTQELLSTFSTSLGEVALQPSTGGTFIVTITTAADASTTNTTASTLPTASTATAATASTSITPIPTTALTISATTSNPSTVTKTKTKTYTLWNRKVDGGFPETKELKRRVRDVIDPSRGLGHVDRDYGPKKTVEEEEGGKSTGGDGEGGEVKKGGEETKGRKCGGGKWKGTKGGGCGGMNKEVTEETTEEAMKAEVKEEKGEQKPLAPRFNTSGAGRSAARPVPEPRGEAKKCTPRAEGEGEVCEDCE